MVRDPVLIDVKVLERIVELAVEKLGPMMVERLSQDLVMAKEWREHQRTERELGRLVEENARLRGQVKGLLERFPASSEEATS